MTIYLFPCVMRKRFITVRYADAGEDFLLTRSSLRGEAFIDYQQLGLPFTLYLYQVM